MLLHLKKTFYCTVNPLLGPWGAFLFQAYLGGGGHLIETGNLEKMVVSVLHSEIKYTVKAKDQNQINFHLVNKPSWISPQKVLQVVDQDRQACY